MPSIDRLVTARYLPAAPHPLRRRPWRPRPGPSPVARPLPLSERVVLHLAAADRARRRRRAARLALGIVPALALCAGEAVVLRWPHLGLGVITTGVHAAGALLITLTALRRIRDGLFAPQEMAQAATIVTILLLILVATALGCMLWRGEDRATPVLPGHRTEELP
ncbi:MAG: hypothetical protein NVSMB65_19160 [Chloroflexota bacterium]